MAQLNDAVRPALPDRSGEAVFAGRVWRPDVDGPSVVVARGADPLYISAVYPTMRDLCEAPDPARALRQSG